MHLSSFAQAKKRREALTELVRTRAEPWPTVVGLLSPPADDPNSVALATLFKVPFSRQILPDPSADSGPAASSIVAKLGRGTAVLCEAGQIEPLDSVLPRVDPLGAGWTPLPSSSSSIRRWMSMWHNPETGLPLIRTLYTLDSAPGLRIVTYIAHSGTSPAPDMAGLLDPAALPRVLALPALSGRQCPQCSALLEGLDSACAACADAGAGAGAGAAFPAPVCLYHCPACSAVNRLSDQTACPLCSADISVPYSWVEKTLRVLVAHQKRAARKADRAAALELHARRKRAKALRRSSSTLSVARSSGLPLNLAPLPIPRPTSAIGSPTRSSPSAAAVAVPPSAAVSSALAAVVASTTPPTDSLTPHPVDEDESPSFVLTAPPRPSKPAADILLASLTRSFPPHIRWVMRHGNIPIVLPISDYITIMRCIKAGYDSLFPFKTLEAQPRVLRHLFGDFVWLPVLPNGSVRKTTRQKYAHPWRRTGGWRATTVFPDVECSWRTRDDQMISYVRLRHKAIPDRMLMHIYAGVSHPDAKLSVHLFIPDSIDTQAVF